MTIRNSDVPKYLQPDWEFLFQNGDAWCAADAATVRRYYCDRKNDRYYLVNYWDAVVASLTREEVDTARKDHDEEAKRNRNWP